MIGITEIGTYIPEGRISNLARAKNFETDEDFIRNKIGITEVAVKSKEEDTSTLAKKAFNNLAKKIQIDTEKIEVIILVTQSPDKNIPHTAAIVHGELGLPESCACFDISLGCSGFVYGLSTIISFMKENNFKNGILFTSDPYSKIVDPNDKNTSLLFGDGATATLLTNQAVLIPQKFNFGSIGKNWESLFLEKDGMLNMNGRGIFNFAARYVPKDVQSLLDKNGMEHEQIDKFVFHQGSKYIVETISKKIGLDKDDYIFDAHNYGNTVSSSIPIILEKLMCDQKVKNILISGFGVGLSWASTILTRQQ